MTRYTLLTRSRKNGSTLYDHFVQVEKVTGTWPPEYAPLPPPEGTEHIWHLFWELRVCAPVDFNGPSRIGFADLYAWEQVRGLKLPNVVIDMLLHMDSAYMEEYYRDAGKR